jgi:hypothetical protein
MHELFLNKNKERKEDIGHKGTKYHVDNRSSLRETSGIFAEVSRNLTSLFLLISQFYIMVLRINGSQLAGRASQTTLSPS